MYTHMWCARATRSHPVLIVIVFTYERRSHVSIYFRASLHGKVKLSAVMLIMYESMTVCSCCSVTRFGNWIFHQHNVLFAQANGRTLDNSEWKRWNHTKTKWNYWIAVKNDYEGHTYIFHWVVTVMLRMSDSNSESRLNLEVQSTYMVLVIRQSKHSEGNWWNGKNRLTRKVFVRPLPFFPFSFCVGLEMQMLGFTFGNLKLWVSNKQKQDEHKIHVYAIT